MRAISASLTQANTAEDEPGLLDVIVVGAGPAGLAAALQAREAGLAFALLEQGEQGGAVRSYPRQKIVMTAPAVLPGYGTVKLRRTTKEALLELWDEVIAKTGVRVENGVRVESGVQRADGVWILRTSAGERRARRVLLAIGRRGTPRRLGVPGESLEKVTYQLGDAAQYRGTRCVVVGAGDSAIEVALSLSSEVGTEVVLAHRGPRIERAKPDNQAKLASAVQRGTLRVRANTQLERIAADTVTFSGEAPGEVGNDFVFICIGGELPTAFLRTFGIEVRTLHGAAIMPAAH